MSVFVTGKCRLKVKSTGVTCQDGVKMAYFGHAYCKKGDKFSRELDFWLTLFCARADSAE